MRSCLRASADLIQLGIPQQASSGILIYVPVTTKHLHFPECALFSHSPFPLTFTIQRSPVQTYLLCAVAAEDHSNHRCSMLAMAPTMGPQLGFTAQSLSS